MLPLISVLGRFNVQYYIPLTYNYLGNQHIDYDLIGMDLHMGSYQGTCYKR